MIGRSGLGVFAGPSLPLAHRSPHAMITYYAPAASGDLAAAARRHPMLLLIDGSRRGADVSSKEILGALRGTRILGAADIGALRAVEHRPYGMIAHGIVARWYAGNLLAGDDEIASAVDRDATASVSLVDVRFAARCAERRGLISKAEERYIVDASRTIYFMDRQWSDVYALVPEAVRRAFISVCAGCCSVKVLDAIAALRFARRKAGIDA